MAKRVTKAAAWANGQEAAAFEHFRSVLGGLPDPRRRQGLRYPLETVIAVALMSMVCGADDAEAMQSWGEAHEDWLSSFLEMPHGSPTQDVILAVFAAIDSVQFEGVFRSWVSFLTVRRSSDDRQIAVDGKTNRRTFDRASGQPALHMVSALLVEAGLVLGQVATREKSNEITAIPELLELLDIDGATITIDAMGCQKDIAKTIRKGGGHYLLAVKENQPTLFKDICASFDDAVDTAPRPSDQAAPLPLASWQDTDAGHGRIEERELHICSDLSWLTTAHQWPDLAFIARATSKRTVLSTGKTSSEHRYFIGSDAKATPARTGQKVRGHWEIETTLHWTLDVGFNEDQARHRAGNCARNLATLRHFAFNLLKSESTSKLGVANRRKRAGWNNDYLLSVLAGEPV